MATTRDILQIDMRGSARKGVAELSGGFSNLAKVAVPAIAAAGALGAAIVANTARYTENVKELSRLSRATGASIEALSGLDYAFRRSGLEAEDLGSVIAEVGIKIGDALEGNEGTIAAFERLGLDAEKLRLSNPEQAFLDVAAALDQVQNAADRVHLADTIFGGDDGRRILAVAGDLEFLTEEAEKFGAVITQEGAEAVEQFNQSLNVINAAIEGAANQMAVRTIQFIQPFVDTITRVLGENPTIFIDFINTVFDQLNAAIAPFTTIGQSIASALTGGLHQTLLDGLTTIQNTITGFINDPIGFAISAVQGILSIPSPVSTIHQLIQDNTGGRQNGFYNPSSYPTRAMTLPVGGDPNNGFYNPGSAQFGNSGSTQIINNFNIQNTEDQVYEAVNRGVAAGFIHLGGSAGAR